MPRRHSSKVLYFTFFNDIIMAGHVARMKEGRSAFKILTGKSTGRRPVGRLRRRWKDNIRMDHKEIGAIARI